MKNMVVEKVCMIKTGDFTGYSTTELLNGLKFRAIVLSDYKLFTERHFINSFDNENKESYGLKEYRNIVSKKLRKVIAEIEQRASKDQSRNKKLSKLSDSELNQLFLKIMSRLWNTIKRHSKGFELFLVFYQGNLKTLLNEVYLRYSGVDIQKNMQQILDIKNGFISYKLLLAKLWGDQLIAMFEKIQDYDATSDEEMLKLEKELLEKLRRTNKWYLSRDDNLKWLCRSYGISY